jgi:hypothetical protein
MRNDERIVAHLTVDDIPWKLPPLDPLMFDPDTLLLADTLRVHERPHAHGLHSERDCSRLFGAPWCAPTSPPAT